PGNPIEPRVGSPIAPVARRLTRPGANPGGPTFSGSCGKNCSRTGVQRRQRTQRRRGTRTGPGSHSPSHELTKTHAVGCCVLNLFYPNPYQNPRLFSLGAAALRV